MRKILKFILKILAKRVIERYQPIVIGVTGSVGKTTAKEAIYTILSHKFWIRKNEENYNNEIGVPMAVLGMRPFAGKLSAIADVIRSFWLAYGWPKQKFPKFLVLELAADRPGDIQYLTDIVRPYVGVVTAVGEVPVHVEFYTSPQGVAKEKAKLIGGLPGSGLAVLNYDDQTVLEMRERTNAKIITFGFSNLANLWASDTSYFVSDDGERVGGISFKINFGNTFVPARVNNLIAPHQIYGILSGIAVSMHFGMNLVEISGAIENMEMPKHRMNLLRGIKNTMIIDDAYNASPLSMHASLETLRGFAKASRELGKNGRHIAILGDMRELGKYEVDAHREIGNLAAECCDILVTIGSASKFIADSAGNQMSKENIMSFNTSDEAKIKVQEIIREHDVVLVKGSRAMEMEKIIEEIRMVS